MTCISPNTLPSKTFLPKEISGIPHLSVDSVRCCQLIVRVSPRRDFGDSASFSRQRAMLPIVRQSRPDAPFR